jgi:EmrB/QacA subfamily drug resistance transporter
MQASDLSRRRVMLILSGIMLGVLMSALDSTIVGTSMPKIIKDLKGMEHYSWPFTAYMLLSTIAIPIFGKLADIYGRKLIYLTGIFTFSAASILCGMSQNMLQLILCRGLQGIGGGILISNAFAVVGELFPPRERGKYAGFVSAMFGLANLLGPSIGGFITDWLNWRWVFYVNIPIALVAIIIVSASLPSAIEHTEKRSIDFAGIGALIAAFTPMLTAFSLAGRTYAWLSPQIMAMMGFSLLMLILFLFIESRVKEPIMPLFLFKSSIFNISITGSFLANAAMFGSVVFIPLFVQGVTGANASRSGLITTPMMVTFVIFSILGGQIVSRTGKYKILSLTAFFNGIIGMVLLSTLNVSTPDWMIITYIIVLGAGLGLNTATFNIIVQNAFPMRYLGVTTSSIQFFRNIGGTFGIAVLGSVMLSSLAGKIRTINWADIPEVYAGQFRDPKLLSNPSALALLREHLPAAALPYFDNILNQVRIILSSSIRQVFLMGIGILLIAFIATIFLKELPLSKKIEEKSKDEPVETCDNC